MTIDIVRRLKPQWELVYSIQSRSVYSQVSSRCITHSLYTRPRRLLYNTVVIQYIQYDPAARSSEKGVYTVRVFWSGKDIERIGDERIQKGLESILAQPLCPTTFQNFCNNFSAVSIVISSRSQGKTPEDLPYFSDFLRIFPPWHRGPTVCIDILLILYIQQQP